jgi:DNA-binding IclR family transcriptional regulator
MTKAPPTRGFRADRTLLSHGYVVRDPSGSRYQLGHRAAESGRFGFTDLDVPSLCAPFARQLVAISGETVSLVGPIGRSNVVSAASRVPDR